MIFQILRMHKISQVDNIVRQTNCTGNNRRFSLDSLSMKVAQPLTYQFKCLLILPDRTLLSLSGRILAGTSILISRRKVR